MKPNRQLDHRSFVLVALMALAAGQAFAASEPPLLVEDLATKALQPFDPAYAVPNPSIAFNSVPAQTPIQVVGCDVTQGKETRPAVAAVVREGYPFVIGLYWRLCGELEGPAHLRLRIVGSGPTLEQPLALRAAGCKIGGLYKSAFTDAAKGSRYAGDAVLSILLLPPAVEKETALFSIPIHIKPLLARSTVSPDRLRAVFGARARRLNVSLRLGKGASATIPVPPGIPFKVGGIGIVSAVGYSGFFAAGTPVAAVHCERNGADLEKLQLDYGVGTLHQGLAQFRPEERKRYHLPVFSSQPSGPGKTAVRETFVARLHLANPQTLSAVKIDYLPSTGVLDIGDVVLLPE